MKKEFLDLGRQPIANNFVEKWSEDEFWYDLKVVFDEDTSLVSLKDFVKPEMMFNENYVYNTSQSTPMIKHFRETANKLSDRFNPLTVLEIGSNSGTFIENFGNDYSVCVEPCDNFAKITGEMGYNTYTEFWDTELSNKIKNTFTEGMDLIYAANCICHIQDLDDCFSAVRNLLSDKGVFVFEDPSLLKMLERGSYDQIYDEHAHIFSVTALDNILKRNGLMIFDVENLSVHGGSNRIYVKKPNIPSDNTITQNYYKNIKEEKDFGIDNFETYKIFAKRVEDSRIDLLNLIYDIRESGGKIISIGATSKSTTVFNYCGINEASIECITDTTPEKQNTIAPGSHIPVVDRDSINLNDYTHAFLGAWNFKELIADKEREFVENGGKFITHVPKVMVFS
jgi:methylation protein EvaC|tara:strand:+ start:17002 stop:18189 length:1188 start_codon:yes stop_codon:yes gene_type:complete